MMNSSKTVVVVAGLLAVEIAVLHVRLEKRLNQLWLTLIPWLNNLNDKLQLPKTPGLPPYQPDTRSGVQ